MEALLVAGGWLFWTILTVAFIVISVALYHESGPSATVSILISFVILNWLFGLHIPEWIAANAHAFVLWVFGYIGLGITWSIVKWYFYVLNRRDEAIEEYGYAKRDKLRVEAPDPQKWMKERIPQASHNKALIVLWMSYWPFSAAETVLNDPIRRLFLFAFRQIQGLMQSIADHVFSNVEVK